MEANAHRGWSGGRFFVKETTADIGVVAEGPTPEAAMASAVAGMYWVISPDAKVREVNGASAEGTAPDAALAFARALQRLLGLFDAEGFLAGSATVEMDWAEPARCRIQAKGEPFDPARHPQGVEIKAVTHHELVVDRARRRVEVIFDI